MPTSIPDSRFRTSMTQSKKEGVCVNMHLSGVAVKDGAITHVAVSSMAGHPWQHYGQCPRQFGKAVRPPSC